MPSVALKGISLYYKGISGAYYRETAKSLTYPFRLHLLISRPRRASCLLSADTR